MAQRLCRAVVLFDLIVQGEPAARVAGGCGVELFAERNEGTGTAGRAERVEAHVQDAAAGVMSPLVVRASRMRAYASSPTGSGIGSQARPTWGIWIK